MNASEPLEVHLGWLFARQRFGVKPGLERVEALLARLGDPQEGFESVLVGGTNGKGSAASTLSHILNAAGWRAGLFTSPHLTHFAERFVVAGERVGEGALADALSEVRPHAEALGATFFEVVTALGCLLFARAGVEVAVMEVGLGGRFDATNALSPRLSVITGVALDHTDVLGETVAEIAAEKAGIMRTGRPCVTGAAGEALQVLKGEAGRIGAALWALGRDVSVEARDGGWEGLDLRVGGPLGEVAVHTPLLGLHQARNVALAVIAAQLLGVDEEAIREGVARTRWAGRLEPLPFRGRTFLLDGAHNPDAAAALARTLEALGAAPVRLVFGASSDKDVEGTVRALERSVGEVILTRARLSPRAARPEDLAPLWRVPCVLTAGPEEALAVALQRSEPGGVIVVAGSLYLVGEVRPLLLGETGESWARFQ